MQLFDGSAQFFLLCKYIITFEGWNRTMGYSIFFIFSTYPKKRQQKPNKNNNNKNCLVPIGSFWRHEFLIGICDKLIVSFCLWFLTLISKMIIHYQLKHSSIGQDIVKIHIHTDSLTDWFLDFETSSQITLFFDSKFLKFILTRLRDTLWWKTLFYFLAPWQFKQTQSSS